MLLLYWPIFLISGSNEQLQQQLEYTLLKPDCHSWWISKMQSDTLQERYVIKLSFKLRKNATETYGMLQTAFRPSCMHRASVSEWHAISFQTFFVWAFRIVIDSWKVSMLLLYIWWDDWPIFMISGSKEQLQQQLEYTPDCHSWWI